MYTQPQKVASIFMTCGIMSRKGTLYSLHANASEARSGQLVHIPVKHGKTLQKQHIFSNCYKE